MPAASIAVTENVWLLADSPFNVTGVEHGAAVAPSRLQVNVVFGSEAKENKADVELLGSDGLELKVGATGGVVSYVQPHEVAGLTFVPSVAFTEKTCAPSVASVT